MGVCSGEPGSVGVRVLLGGGGEGDAGLSAACGRPSKAAKRFSSRVIRLVRVSKISPAGAPRRVSWRAPRRRWISTRTSSEVATVLARSRRVSSCDFSNCATRAFASCKRLSTSRSRCKRCCSISDRTTCRSPSLAQLVRRPKTSKLVRMSHRFILISAC